MLMPKELAPYAGILAPMLTGPIGGFSGLGIGGGLALGQLGSAKMNSGKLDPYQHCVSNWQHPVREQENGRP